MADLTGFNLDANVQESTGSAEILPSDNYKVCLISDEVVDNSKNTGKILKIQLQVMEGQYAGAVVKDNLNILNQSPQCQSIGQGTLKRICNLCNSPFPPQNTTALMGKPMMIRVVNEPFKSNTPDMEGKYNMIDSNKIKKYDAVTANPPQHQQQPQQNQQNVLNNNTGGGW